MGSKITFEEVEGLARKGGLGVIDDFVISLSNGKFSIVIDSVGCLQEPPYTTLYDKKRVVAAINKLSK